MNEQNDTAEAMRKCKACGRLLTLGEFYRTGTSKEGRRYKCKACVRAYQREHNRRPDVRERTRSYRQEWEERPEVEARSRDYHREYNERPEVKARKTAYLNQPEFVARRKAYYATSAAVARGELEPASALLCVDCGEQANRYFYESYDVPRKRTPLCFSCHRRRVSRSNE